MDPGGCGATSDVAQTGLSLATSSPPLGKRSGNTNTQRGDVQPHVQHRDASVQREDEEEKLGKEIAEQQTEG